MAPTPTLPTVFLGLTIWGLIGVMTVAWCWAILQFALRRSLLPPATPRMVPWGGTEAFGVFCLYLFLQVYGPSVLLVLLNGLGLKGKLGPSGIFFVQLAISAAFLALAWAFLVLRVGAAATDLGLQSNRAARDVRTGLVGALLLIPVAFGLNHASQQIWTPVDHDLVKVIARGQSAATWALGAFMAVIAAPIVEEFLFRGVLLGALNRRAVSNGENGLDPDFATYPANSQQPSTGLNASKVTLVASSVLLSNVGVSLLFAMQHTRYWPTPIPLFFASLAFGAMFQRTGSLLVPIVMHATLNGVSTLLLMLTIMTGRDVTGGPEKAPPIPAPAVEKTLKVTVVNTPRPLCTET